MQKAEDRVMLPCTLVTARCSAIPFVLAWFFLFLFLFVLDIRFEQATKLVLQEIPTWRSLKGMSDGMDGGNAVPYKRVSRPSGPWLTIIRFHEVQLCYIIRTLGVDKITLS
jgi:hypothetical protein